ncbi:YihY/virulence factor BrkB family protein [Lignipirellula cremea]|nr:YihY/virulence factor BrkB family protein [Lignipirellula cremea]
MTTAAVGDFLQDDCMGAAAGIAYYTIFSLPPLLVLIFGVANWCGVSQETMERIVTAQIGLPASFANRESGEGDQAGSGAFNLQQITSDQDGESKPGPLTWMGPGAKIVGLLLLFFSASGVFGHVQGALNRAWEVRPDPNRGGLWSFLSKRVMSFGIILVIAFLLLVSFVLTTLIDEIAALVVGRDPGGWGIAVGVLVNNLVAFVVTCVLFASMFKVLPDAKVAWRDIWFGAAATALLFIIGKSGLGWYLQRSDLGSSWGSAASSMIAILVYVYYTSLIVLLGAEITQAWAREFGGGIAPAEGAIRVVEQEHQIDEEGRQKTVAARDSHDTPDGEDARPDTSGVDEYLKIAAHRPEAD